MVSDAQMLRNDDFIPGAGGTPEISRWCNHRTTPTKHEPRPERAREGRAGAGGQHRRGTFERFSRPCRGAYRIGGGGAARFRWFPVAPRPSPPANLFRASGSHAILIALCLQLTASLKFNRAVEQSLLSAICEQAGPLRLGFEVFHIRVPPVPPKRKPPPKRCVPWGIESHYFRCLIQPSDLFRLHNREIKYGLVDQTNTFGVNLLRSWDQSNRLSCGVRVIVIREI